MTITMADNTTTPKTLWTETIFEILLDTLTTDKSDKHVVEALRNLKEKKIKGVVIVSYVDKKLGKKEAIRVKSLLQKGI